MRKFSLLFFSLFLILSAFSLRVNASNPPVYLSNLSFEEPLGHLKAYATIRVGDEDEVDFDDRYFLDMSYFISHYQIEYDSVSVSVSYSFSPDGQKTPINNSYYEYDEQKSGVKLEFILDDEVRYYFVDIDYDTYSRHVSGSLMTSLVVVRLYNAQIPQSIPNVFSTTASITISSNGKGTLNGSINFASNTYANGWYCLDLNYVREYYGFKQNISSATFSCATNSTLSNVLNSSVNFDAGGNVVYFPLPDLNNIQDTITYVIVFGTTEAGTTINDVGSKVKITRITNNTSTQALAFSGEQYSIRIPVDNPPSIAQIISQTGLVAVDDYSGNRTLTYTDSNQYEAKVSNKNNIKDRELGEYNIVFGASDTKNNSSSLAVKVIVEDKVSPVINTDQSTLFYERGYSDLAIDNSTFQNGIVATDNYDGIESLSIFVDSNVYLASYNQVNNYVIPVTVTDSSGNSSQTQITMRVYDNVPPVITGASSFTTSYTSDITASEIISKCGVSATDVIDNDLNIIVANDTYTANKNIPGEYEIVVRATDDENNYAEFTISVTVTDAIMPFFLINKTTLIVENGYAYTPSEILDAAISSGLIRVDYTDVEVVVDEYTDNTSVAGTYLYRLRVTYSDGVEEYVDINLHVLGEDNEIIKVKWYVKLGNFFTRTFTKIGHFFSDVVYEKGIKKVFNFVKDVWNKVFRR